MDRCWDLVGAARTLKLGTCPYQSVAGQGSVTAGPKRMRQGGYRCCGCRSLPFGKLSTSELGHNLQLERTFGGRRKRSQ